MSSTVACAIRQTEGPQSYAFICTGIVILPSGIRSKARVRQSRDVLHEGTKRGQVLIPSMIFLPVVQIGDSSTRDMTVSEGPVVTISRGITDIEDDKNVRVE